jgi:hypothetical protein
MPPRRSAHVSLARIHRRQAGRGRVLNWLKKAAGTVGSFIKKHGLISKAAGFLAPRIGGPIGAAIGQAGTAAGAMGLGRRRRGGALRLAGGYRPRRRY